MEYVVNPGRFLRKNKESKALKISTPPRYRPSNIYHCIVAVQFIHVTRDLVAVGDSAAAQHKDSRKPVVKSICFFVSTACSSHHIRRNSFWGDGRHPLVASSMLQPFATCHLSSWTGAGHNIVYSRMPSFANTCHVTCRRGPDVSISCT